MNYPFLTSAVLAAFAIAPATAQHQAHDQPAMDMPGMTIPSSMPPAEPKAPAEPPAGHAMAGMDAAPIHVLNGALGPYALSREASGTAWQPDASEHRALHLMLGEWMLMGHALLNTAYDGQQGPRGADKAFVSGMVMGSARRDFPGGSTLQLRAMFSPEPSMGKRGYPLLLAAGESADGATPLVDRQHPHDAFMELSASYSLRLSDRASLFVYGGLPGEPAFGPPAFMHRLSIMDSPEAPISHHWLDSTHIVFGVVTAGVVAGDVKLEASRFNGREPDQHRWNIETGALDSTAIRLSWNPARTLSMQASWARLVSPEQLDVSENQTRWSASLIHTRPIGTGGGYWSTSLAWGRRSSGHRVLDAFALESAVRRGSWTVFARAERTENDELAPLPGHHGPAYRLGKLSAGFVRDFRAATHVTLGAGALASLNVVPETLQPTYGNNPKGAMAFVRVRID